MRGAVMRGRLRRGAAFLLFLLTLTVSLTASAEIDLDPGCSLGISAEATKRAYDKLISASDPGCEFIGVTTERAVLDATWSRDGSALPPGRIAVSACLRRPDLSREFVTEVPPELAKACPHAAEAVASLGAAFAVEESAVGGVPMGPIRLAAGLLVLAFLLCAAHVATLAQRGTSPERVALLGSLGLVVLAFAVRAGVPFAPANWYLETLPARGPPPSLMFGAGAHALPWLLRGLGMWSEEALFRSVLALGIATVPLVAVLAFQLGARRAGALFAGALFAVQPLHARMSASGAEHVTALFFLTGAVVAWLSALRVRSIPGYALALVLAVLAASTRIDVFFQLGFLPAASLFVAHELQKTPMSRGALLPHLAASGLWALLGAILLFTTVASSRHPLPTSGEVWNAAQSLLPQLGRAAATDPTWLPGPTVAIAGLSAGILIVRRPWACALSLLGLGLTCIPLGRSLGRPFLVDVRYFNFVALVLCVTAGEALAFVVDLALARSRARFSLVALALTATATIALTLLAGRSALAVRATFQDEYSFLRETLARLPEGCDVMATPQRPPDLPRDLDCCLDLPRSPLVLALPALHFRSLETFPTHVPGDAACVVYVESAACSLASFGDDRGEGDHRPQWRGALDRYVAGCESVRAALPLREVSETEVSDVSSQGLFSRGRPRTRVFRVR